MRPVPLFCFLVLAATGCRCFAPRRPAAAQQTTSNDEQNGPTEVRPVENSFSMFVERVPAPPSHSKLSDNMFRMEPHLIMPGRGRKGRRHKRTAGLSDRRLMPAALPRHKRPTRKYDVPQVECPPAHDGTEKFSCPSEDHLGRYRCIDDRGLCDGFIDCANGEDEDVKACMYFKTTRAHLDILADALLRWARGRH